MSPVAMHHVKIVNVIIDAGRLIFPLGHPTADWPAELQYMVYGPSDDDDKPFAPPAPVVYLVNPASRPHSLALHDSIAILPTALLPVPVVVLSPPMAAASTPPVLPPALVTPILPTQTTYGPVRSRLALACTGEKACINALLQRFDIIWGPYPDAKGQNLLAKLPGDQLVFLCMLGEFVVLKPVFASFLHPAIADFVNGWVTHLEQDSFG
ncbi:hypothetical protein C8R43DRAFT_1122929 [Mycena crocata]|nr:hypothetical protein C8R43DRAFT_1122929 [Mycena crocata]